MVKKLPKNNQTKNNILSSFRDPSGFVFSQNGIVYRQINSLYKNDYSHFVESGLFKKLVSMGYLVSHIEVSNVQKQTEDEWKIIKPEQVPFISYPYEWSFSMLKDAAFTTLSIAKIALEHGMILKDATAFNIQFLKGKPVLIDTLSFEIYEEGKPWQAYKQFIEHFVSPLLLMSMVDVRLGKLSELFIDGVPIDLASRLLPLRSRLNINILLHIHAHASTQKKYNNKKVGDVSSKRFGKTAFLGLLDNLESVVKKTQWIPKGTQWAEYYEEDNNNYKSDSLTHKAKLVDEFVSKIKPKIVWDMGANTGYFSKIAAKYADLVVAFDVDYGAIEKGYASLVKEQKMTNILPLFSDLTNPTPSIGWSNKERFSLFERGPVDAVLALALIHHLAISHNLSFSYIASCFLTMGKYLIIEFVNKEDSQVQILLQNRKDIFPDYNQKAFEESFSEYFHIKKSVPIKGSKRVLYLMQRIDS